MGSGVIRGIIAGLVCWALPAAAGMEFDYSGYVEPELRLFTQLPSDERQEDANLSIAGQVEFEFLFDNDQALIFTTFGRIDLNDDQRTHFDLREGYYEAVFDRFELRVGAKRIFWGRTEAVHLIDIINQTDTIENVDGEDKLGQPMVNVTVPTSVGIFDFYWLPYFRERTFEGPFGRPRFDLPISNEIALYEHGDAEWHQDFAVRWSHYIGAWDFGISYFSGTARRPLFQFALDKNFQPILIPYYTLIEQTSVDVQATFGPALFKFEGFRRDQLGQNWLQATGGIEYSFYQAFGSDGDLGIIAEYIWDERGESGLFPFQNDIFGGLRWAANDIQSTTFLLGGIADADGNGYAFSFEAQRRLGEDFLLSIEGRSFVDVPPGDPLYSFSDDDFLQIRMARYF